MKAQDVLCYKCGGKPEIHGSDHLNDYGPWNVSCFRCGRGTDVWAYQREAWAQWKYINGESPVNPAEAKEGECLKI